MRLKMTLSDKFVSTLFAIEGSLSCVSPHVSLEVASLLEFFEAAFKRTDEKFYFVLGSLHSLDVYQR